jgi:transcriptional regulator with XRE-family HTH domain
MELSQREVAVYAGCSQQSFSRYEAGVATPPKAYRIRICKLLHVAETALWTAAEMARADGARLQRSA